MSVEVIPSQLGFQRPLTQLVKRTLTVFNPNPQPIAFKVKTTAPKQYCVRPNSGRIEPGERVEVSVLLQPMKEDPEPGAKCRDKFLVQSTIITPERESRPFSELWSLVEKEDKGSIAEYKIRCAYLPASPEDINGNLAPSDHLTAKGLTPNLHLNNHSHRDDDDDPRYNSVRSQVGAGYHGAFSSPPNRTDAELPDTTLYDMARDDVTSARQTRTSISASSQAPIKVLTSAPALNSHSSSPTEDRKMDSGSKPPSLNRVSSGNLSTHASKLPTTNGSHSTDDLQALRSQLSVALAEIERLKKAIEARDEGLRKRPSKASGHSNSVHSADMMTLTAHGLKGPDGLVPVQTVVLISIGVFAFTWLFF